MKPAAITPHIPSFAPDLRSDVFNVGHGQIRLRAVLDSAASEHVVGSGVADSLLSPMSMVSRVANGAEARSTGQLNTTSVNFIYIREIPSRGVCPWITPAGLVR